MGHEGKDTQTIGERERETETEREMKDGKTGGSLGKFTHTICARCSAVQLAFPMLCLWNGSTDLSNIDSLIFQAWLKEITLYFNFFHTTAKNMHAGKMQ